LKTADFEYNLPERLIARRPPARRDHSRLMTFRRDGALALEHKRFDALPSLLRPGDLLVLNESRVIPARLMARRDGSGGKIEIFLLKERAPCLWQTLVRPGKKVKPGDRLIVSPRQFEAEVLGYEGKGERLIRFETKIPWDEALEKFGHTPLPPYILKARKRDSNDAGLEETGDRERYQTVYASSRGASVAAPTAGLHFSPQLLAECQKAGIEIARIELNVGAGTFKPVETNDPRDHAMHTEQFRVLEEAATAINRAKNQGRRIVAVGTTVVRVLETLAAQPGGIQACDAATDIYIFPGFQFRAVDVLLTNFHLPRSTLLMLVSGFAGRERVLKAYREAVKAEYRFYSYGDAMLIH